MYIYIYKPYKQPSSNFNVFCTFSQPRVTPNSHSGSATNRLYIYTYLTTWKPERGCKEVLFWFLTGTRSIRYRKCNNKNHHQPWMTSRLVSGRPFMEEWLTCTFFTDVLAISIRVFTVRFFATVGSCLVGCCDFIMVLSKVAIFITILSDETTFITSFSDLETSASAVAPVWLLHFLSAAKTSAIEELAMNDSLKDGIATKH